MPMLVMLTVIVGAVASDEVTKADIASGEVTRERLALRELSAKASSGDPKAIYNLATLHDTGYDSIPVDSAASTALYRLSAEKGYAPAMNYLGFRYFNGDYVRQDIDSALYWLAKAAGAGDAKAASNLGYLLSHDDAVTRDYPQAVYWLTKASDAGLPVAQSLLADLLRQGLGIPKDTARAERLYTSAIEHGLQDAELKLLSMKGREWEKLSPDSAVTLGRYFYTHRAPFIGITLFENAAAYYNPAALALLGDAYSRAVGVEYDHDRSLAYFLRSALLGQPSAQFVIGELLDIFPDALADSIPSSIITEFYPDSLPPSIFTAPYWYDKAAAAGITNAETASNYLLNPKNANVTH